MKHLVVVSIILIATFRVYSQDSTKVRFDGVYQTETRNNTRSFLRFYPDGTVISATSTGQAKNLSNWFTKEKYNKPWDSRGKYEIKNKNIYFTTSSQSGTVVYEGVIKTEYELSLNIKSLINGNQQKDIYYFIMLTKQ